MCPPDDFSAPEPDQPTRGGSRLLVVLLGLMVVGGLAAAPMVWPADGQERSTLALFFGRFHPLILHFPIALLALVPVLEVSGMFSRGAHLRASVGFVLWLATLSSIFATLLGWLLAWAGGYSGDLVNAHMWSGCTLSLTCMLAALLRRTLVTRGWWSPGFLYPPALLAALALLVWTAHQGGQLTHGEKYLEEHMPAPMRAWLGLPPVEKRTKAALVRKPTADTAVEASGGSVSTAEISFFEDRIMPAMDRTCVSCHNPNKVKGGLRMDTFAELMKGGDSGPSIVPGDAAASELYRRITLPHDDEEFMPSGGKKPLSADETRWIELWIEAGASETAGLSAFGEAPAKPVVAEVVQQAPDYRGRLTAVQAWEKSWGLRLVPVSQVATDGLIVRTASAPSRCTDEALVALAPLVDLIVDAELARTAVTDRGLAAIATWTNLRRLDLTQTAVTSPGVGALAPLKRLELLNLTATGVEEAGLEPFRARTDLKLYVEHAPAGAR